MMKNVRMARKGTVTPRWYPGDDKISDNSGVGTNTTTVKGSGAPKKSRPFTNYAPNTKPPQGRALPVRGENDSD